LNYVCLRPSVESIDYSAFKSKIDSGEIHRVEIAVEDLIGFTLTRALHKKSRTTS